MSKVEDGHLIGPPYYAYNSTSTFDCYNECIKNPSCDFACFKNENDIFLLSCLLYNDLNEQENRRIDAKSPPNGDEIEIMKISGINKPIDFKINK